MTPDSVNPLLHCSIIPYFRQFLNINRSCDTTSIRGHFFVCRILIVCSNLDHLPLPVIAVLHAVVNLTTCAMAEVRLKWFHTFLFLFQAILTIADTSTDIMTCLTYRANDDQQWFAVSLGVTLLTLIVLCIWSVIASTSRTWTKDDADDETGNPDVIFRSTTINVALACLCVGPPLHSVQLFIFCACRFKELWNSPDGLRIEKDRLYYLYVHTLNLKMVEGLLESAPQLMIQVYVMVMQREEAKIELIQMISAPISFLALVWMSTSMEVLREFEKYNLTFLHNVIIFLGNAGMIAARTLAIVFFTLYFPWRLPYVIGVHCLVMVATGFLLWRSNRKQDMFVFIFAYSPFYLFVYSSYYLKKLRGTAPFGAALQTLSTILWHTLFTAENIVMISVCFFLHDENKWINTSAFAAVLIGNIGGILIKWLSWCCCFSGQPQGDESIRRPTTIILRPTN